MDIGVVVVDVDNGVDVVDVDIDVNVPVGDVEGDSDADKDSVVDFVFGDFLFTSASFDDVDVGDVTDVVADDDAGVTDDLMPDFAGNPVTSVSGSNFFWMTRFKLNAANPVSSI